MRIMRSTTVSTGGYNNSGTLYNNTYGNVLHFISKRKTEKRVVHTGVTRSKYKDKHIIFAAALVCE